MIRKILVLGDSHSVYFHKSPDINRKINALRDIEIKVIKLIGATIKGLGKKSSTLNSNLLFKEAIQKNSPDCIVFALGQVDIEFGFFFRKFVKNDNLNFDDFCKQVSQLYLSSIKKILLDTSFSKKIVIKGINNTLLTFHRWKAIHQTKIILTEYVNDKKEIDQISERLDKEFPYAEERANNHLKFNKFLKDTIKGEYLYFDINDEINDYNGFVKLEHVPAWLDHHLNDSIYIRMLHLKKLIEIIS